jgi:hypothetical protein
MRTFESDGDRIFAVRSGENPDARVQRQLRQVGEGINLELQIKLLVTRQILALRLRDLNPRVGRVAIRPTFRLHLKPDVYES